MNAANGDGTTTPPKSNITALVAFDLWWAITEEAWILCDKLQTDSDRCGALIIRSGNLYILPSMQSKKKFKKYNASKSVH